MMLSKIHILLLPVLIFFLLPPVRAVPPATNIVPGIVCTNRVFDFGVIAGGEPVEHDFILANPGSLPLKISKVRACCGASALLSTNIVQPGSNTVLRISLPVPGGSVKINKSIYVHSNDPTSPILQLKLKGEIVHDGASSQP